FSSSSKTTKAHYGPVVLACRQESCARFRKPEYGATGKTAPLVQECSVCTKTVWAVSGLELLTAYGDGTRALQDSIPLPPSQMGYRRSEKTPMAHCSSYGTAEFTGSWTAKPKHIRS